MATNEKRQLICDRCGSARWAMGRSDCHYGGLAYCRHFGYAAPSPVEVDLCQACYHRFVVWLGDGKNEVARANSG